MKQAVEYQPISLQGTLQVLDWSKNQDELKVGIIDSQGNEFTIQMDSSDKHLRDHLWKMVRLQGVYQANNPFEIYVFSIEVIEKGVRPYRMARSA